MHCTISQIWSLKTFPFDTQVLKFIFQPRESNDLCYLRKMRFGPFATAMSPYVVAQLTGMDHDGYKNGNDCNGARNTRPQMITLLNRPVLSLCPGYPFAAPVRISPLELGAKLIPTTDRQFRCVCH
eukprot:g37565.t1